MNSPHSSSYSVLKYHFNSKHLKKLHILVVCDSPHANRIIAKALADVKADFFINVHTSKSLPMKVNAASQNFDFLVFMIDMSKRFSQINIEESLQFVDVNYFLKQSCLVSIHNTDPVLRNCDVDEIKKLEHKYDIPAFHANFSDEKSIENLAQRIINLTSIACRLYNSIGMNYIEASNLFYAKSSS